MQVTIRPLQILSRIVAVCIVALPLGALQMLVDKHEHDAIGRMSHQELIAYVEEVHASSFAGAYCLATVGTLIVVGFIEALAFAIRCTARLFGPKMSPHACEDEYVPDHADSFH